jgi:hypothetical protein
MATRTIESPGVEINEVDLSLRTVTPVGTKILVHGFASQGPTNELIQVSTKDELDQVFFGGGGPTNAAERYFYSSCREILNSPATLYVTRFPYGSADGTGFNGEYTALAYPVSSDATTITTMTTAATSTVTNFATFQNTSGLIIGTPVVIPLTEENYMDIKSGNINWSTGGGGTISSYDTLGNAAFFIVNDARTTINEKYEGYYLAIADNSVLSLSGGTYNSITDVKTLKSTSNNVIPYALSSLDASLLGFTLTGTDITDSISEKLETSYNYDFNDSSYNDSLLMYFCRLRTSNTESDPDKLNDVEVETYLGSLESIDQRPSPVNGQLESFFLEDKINNNSNYIKMYTNRYLSTRGTIENVISVGRELYPVGSYTPCKTIDDSRKYIGDLDTKIERALALAESVQSLDIDITVGAGLETIFAYTAGTANGAEIFDDTKNVASDIAALSNPDSGPSATFAQYHRTIFNLYNNFCANTRKDCIHYSDPLRGIFVQGENAKTLDRKDKTFSLNILNPLKSLYSTANSNYAATYANWVSIFDNNTSKFVWVPFSAWQAAITARMDARLQPWYAPFGLNNGVIPNITDIAFKSNQKQQDALYRVGINPVVYFQGDGFVVWGQKTLQAKPSAFDRLNVRRLFLVLERSTMKILRYFVGEPNTVFTRTRVNNVLKPIFDLAKNNEGCYDYMIVCDERNNTAAVIDANEMKVDIYIKPVRTAEFILVTFYATRTDQNFNELVG